MVYLKGYKVIMVESLLIQSKSARESSTFLSSFAFKEKTRINWGKSFRKDMKCFNVIKGDELAWKSPFETNYEKKPNELLNEGKNCNRTVLLYNRKKVIRMRDYQNVWSKAIKIKRIIESTK